MIIEVDTISIADSHEDKNLSYELSYFGDSKMILLYQENMS